MAINSCDICGCIPQNVGTEFFNQAALNLLCGILENTQGGGVASAVNVNQIGGVALAFGQALSAASIPVVLASDQDFVKAEDAVHASGDKGIMSLSVRRDTAASGAGTAGDYATINTDANGRLYTQTVGAVGHGQTAVDSPVMTGSVCRSSNPSAFSAGLSIDYLADLIGRQVVTMHGLPENTFVGVSSADITDTTSTSVVPAAGAGLRRYISAITVSNLHATVPTRVDILDNATVIWSGPAAINGGGYTITFPQQLRCSANQAINAQCGTTGAAVRVAISGTTSAQ